MSKHKKLKIQNIIYLCGLWLNTTSSKISSESIKQQGLCAMVPHMRCLVINSLSSVAKNWCPEAAVRT